MDYLGWVLGTEPEEQSVLLTETLPPSFLSDPGTEHKDAIAEKTIIWNDDTSSWKYIKWKRVKGGCMDL